MSDNTIGKIAENRIRKWLDRPDDGYSFDREENKSRIIKQVKGSGYSIEDNALKVQSLYKQYYEQGE